MSKSESGLFKGTSGVQEKKLTQNRVEKNKVTSDFKMSDKYKVDNNPDLVQKVLDKGDKINVSKTLGITEYKGKPVWLEQGKDNAGLKHILLEHKTQFKQIGIKRNSIGECIMEAINKGSFVGYSNSRHDCSVFDVNYNNKNIRIGITISDNGFIVTAMPYSKRKKIWK